MNDLMMMLPLRPPCAGASEIVLGLCNRKMSPDGSIGALTEEDVAELQALIQNMAEGVPTGGVYRGCLQGVSTGGVYRGCLQGVSTGGAYRGSSRDGMGCCVLQQSLRTLRGFTGGLQGVFRESSRDGMGLRVAAVAAHA
eukprot:1192552-Prorocentrum_minimum.AAC.2